MLVVVEGFGWVVVALAAEFRLWVWEHRKLVGSESGSGKVAVVFQEEILTPIGEDLE